MESVTIVLSAVQSGEPEATARLYAALCPEIKRLARARLFGAGGIPSMNTTALVNEGFLRIAQRQGMCGRVAQR